jgi:hypothetical protein
MSLSGSYVKLMVLTKRDSGTAEETRFAWTRSCLVVNKFPKVLRIRCYSIYNKNMSWTLVRNWREHHGYLSQIPVVLLRHSSLWFLTIYPCCEFGLAPIRPLSGNMHEIWTNLFSLASSVGHLSNQENRGESLGPFDEKSYSFVWQPKPHTSRGTLKFC